MWCADCVVASEYLCTACSPIIFIIHHTQVNAAMEATAAALNLKGHMCGMNAHNVLARTHTRLLCASDVSLQLKKVHSAADIEVHKGRDGRCDNSDRAIRSI